MPRLGVSKESLEQKPPVPEGLYEVRFDGFAPKTSKKGDSINYNPVLKIVNNAHGFNDRRIFENLNSNAGWSQKDFCHGFGLAMLTEGDTFYIPGDFQSDPTSPSDVTKWKYTGPLSGRIAKMYLIVSEYEGKQSNKIQRILCAIPGCAEKHSDKLNS